MSYAGSPTRSELPPADPRPAPPRFAAGPVAVVLVAAVAALLATAGRYGYHRDELYFRVAGRHLDWGYVDQPPLVPLLGRLTTTALGDDLTAFRVPAALLTALTVLLAALIARELGGAATGQVLAAVAVATSPYVLATGHLLHTQTVVLTVGAAVCWAAVRALRSADRRWWLAVGALVGVGVYASYLVVLLCGVLLVSLLVTRTFAPLRGPWPWAGAALAAVLAAPAVGWQAAHGWPQWTMADRISEGNQGQWLETLLYQFVLAGPLLFPVAVAGLVGLARRPGWRPVRALAVAYPLMLVLVVLAGGNSYYPGPFLVVLLAAGGVVAADWVARGVWRRTLLGLAVVASVVLSALFSLPLLPERVVADSGLDELNETAAEQFGWTRLVAGTAAVYWSLPETDRARAYLLTWNYGEAGALDRYGAEHGLPRPYSGHNSYLGWGEPEPGRDVAVVVGVPEEVARAWFTRCEVKARVEVGEGVDNEEQGQPIAVCAGPRVPWAEMAHVS
ncbi:glycosyltransferase family 39 protein [Actinosynnema sp. NPDC059797]